MGVGIIFTSPRGVEENNILEKKQRLDENASCLLAGVRLQCVLRFDQATLQDWKLATTCSMICISVIAFASCTDTLPRVHNRSTLCCRKDAR